MVIAAGGRDRDYGCRATGKVICIQFSTQILVCMKPSRIANVSRMK